MNRVTIIAAADGSALGNPGPAGWAWYVDPSCWASGGWPHGTNNMGELTAVLDLLEQTAGAEDDLLIYCDSQYVINSLTKWLPGWKRKGWKKADGQPVLNLDIIQALDAALQGRKVRFEWVKGHAGHPLNEAADRLANAAAQAFSAGTAPERGPGFVGGGSTEPALFELEVTDEDTVVELERELLSDRVRTDPASVAALLHPDWAEIGSSGRWWTREELLAEVAPLPEPTELDVVSVDRLSADQILLVWRSVTATGSVLRSSLWVRDRAGWRQRFHQGTRIP